MKSITKYSLCVILALTLIVLPSCSLFWSSNPTYSGGQILDDELMSSIRAEIIVEESTSAEGSTISETTKEESTTKRESVKSGDSVYWTKSGGVYHFYKDCGYIKSSAEIISGTVEEALEAGKTGVCSRCEGRKDKE